MQRMEIRGSRARRSASVDGDVRRSAGVDDHGSEGDGMGDGRAMAWVMAWAMAWAGLVPHRLARDDGSDRAAAGAVIFYHKLLNADASYPCELAHDEAALAVGRIALVVVRLDDAAFVELGGVCRLVFLRVVWVHRVG